MKIEESMSRRDFINKSSKVTAGVLLGGTLTSGIIPGRVLGANDKITVAAIGTNSRGNYLATVFAGQGAEVKYICDVDKRVVERTRAEVEKVQGKKPRGLGDFRKALEDPQLDAVVIATPDHWHAPMAIMALQAGKHVYVEKPCSHNPREGELLVEAQRKYKKVVQMGNQQRSSKESIEIIGEIRSGNVIGRAYYGRSWYANKRGPIGFGKAAPVPDWLNYDLWQGPAPRRPYRDNLIHYNWHWFWHWGTGETCNNATHELDICRWALDVDFPVRVSSSGGRYHFNDDWEAFDTQNVAYEFEGGKMITWEGRSCNPYPVMNRGRGVTIHGEKGTVLIDRNGYIVYDLDNNVLREVSAQAKSETIDTTGGGSLDERHVRNFFEAIRQSVQPHSEISGGYKSTLLCHLGNISQRVGRSLDCDPGNGHIRNDSEAMNLWSREYEPGWEVRV